MTTVPFCAHRTAAAIFDGFRHFAERFAQITDRAGGRFVHRQWVEMRSDAIERIALYEKVKRSVSTNLRTSFAPSPNFAAHWPDVKDAFANLIRTSDLHELAGTFFNSVTRLLLAPIGVDPQIEFLAEELPPAEQPDHPPVFSVYRFKNDTARLIQQILSDTPLRGSFEDLTRDAERCAHKNSELFAPGARVEMLREPFYRGMGVYLVGRTVCGSQTIPLIFAILNPRGGMIVDALIRDEAGASILFSFTRAYFHVKVRRPYDLVRFLKSIMPRKRIAEIYTAIGFNKHGKTELFRDIQAQVAACSPDQFRTAAGNPGMVMSVFNMADDDIVYKIIKDRFNQPKSTTRTEVLRKYDYVFKHDRAGRLVEAHTFEDLEFDRCHFSEPLLKHLSREAAKTVQVIGERVILRHLFVQRRVTPLNIYLTQADTVSQIEAVIDFGKAIKDLARSDIFPGDMLLKNFGVTRHKRVVFYDFDELCPLLSCRFRKIPRSATYEDELSDEPWFSVSENDVFPEEFEKFLGLPSDLTAIFLQHHGDLFDPRFWRRIQNRLSSGRWEHIYPYAQHHRLAADSH